LLARAYVSASEYGRADELLRPSFPWDALRVADRAAAGPLLVALRRWDVVESWRNAFDADAPLESSQQMLVDWVSAAAAAERDPTAVLDDLRDAREALDTYQVGVTLARALAASGASAEAQQLLEELTRDAPQAPQAWHQLGVLMFNRGEIDRAVGVLEKATEVDPDYPYAYESLGAVAINQEELPAAENFLERATKLYPTRAAGHFLLGMVYAKRSESAPAADALRRALALEPQLIEQVRAMPVFTRLFGEAELQQLLPEAPQASSEPDSAT
jgi:tetratricopeptide (TPR) repeat protein